MSIADTIKFQVSTSHEGLDYKRFQEVYIPSDSPNLVLKNQYIPVGSTSKLLGEWLRDVNHEFGDLDEETRIFCRKGRMELKFTGTNISARIEIFHGWGKGDIYIDNVKPSMIPGLTTAKDTVNFDAGTAPWAGSLGRERVDFLIAAGLSSGEHTLRIDFNNPDHGQGGWCAINSFTTYDASIRDVSRDGWVISTADDMVHNHNRDSITILNDFPDAISGVSVEPSSNTDLKPLDDSGSPLVAVNLGDMATKTEKAVFFRPEIPASIKAGNHNIKLLVKWVQATQGDYTVSTTVKAGTVIERKADSSDFDYKNTWWPDSSGPAGWSARAVTEFANAAIEFTIIGGELDVVVQQDYGWGSLDVFVDGRKVGNASCHDDVGGGIVKVFKFTGLGAGNHNVKIQNAPTHGGSRSVGVFLGAKWSDTITFYHQQIELTWNYNLSYVPPFPVDNPRLENGRVIWDEPDPNKVDLSIPRDNRGIESVGLYWRFPTQITCYFQGWTKLMTDYDIIIFEPGSQSYDDVKHWKSLGIITLGYVSFGEEDGWNTTPWADTATQTPWIGDGQGPGGYASYYLKGGYGYGELNECKSDQQRINGSKTCALSRAEYFKGQGRCSKACGNDWRLGYNDWQKGLPCGANHTKDNYWIRKGNKACSNDKCPDYSPLNSKCPKWESSDTWGQDFSMADKTFPDENGIWSSYYTNSAHPGWLEKLKTYWLPKLFDKQQEVVDIVPFEDHTRETGDPNAKGVQVTKPPMDIGFTPIVKRIKDGHIYKLNLEFGFDPATGCIKLYIDKQNNADILPSVGENLEVRYMARGLECDGVFMDTVDTVDVYPSKEFGQGMIDNIIDLKKTWPDKAFCSNRGFSVMEGTMPYCEFIMFETFFSEYDWENDHYYKISHTSDEWNYNEGIHNGLYNLKLQTQFEVISLNYCANTSVDDDLRKAIAEDSRNRGYIGWSSTILLNEPLPNDEIKTPYAPILTNAWTLIQEHKIDNWSKNG